MHIAFVSDAQNDVDFYRFQICACAVKCAFAFSTGETPLKQKRMQYV